MMRKVGALLTLVLLVSSCARGGDSGSQTRTVRVDYASDEFASYLLSYFPRRLTLRPGDSVVFKQTWTGEAHTVTMGTMVDRAFGVIGPLVDRFKRGEEVTDEEIDTPENEQALEPLPGFFFGESDVAQNGAQPCYLETGSPPKDAKQPCSQQTQPEFNGRQTYYNSGFIPYGGPRGNQFTVRLANDIKPGTYHYYCNVHGPPMSGKIHVKPAGSSIPPEDEVNEQAFAEIEREAGPLRRAFERVQKTRTFTGEGVTVKGNIAGLHVPKVFGGLNEFMPRELNTRVGEKMTWTVIGPHTISFDVPPYFPIFSIRKDGTVLYNPRLVKAAGGAPEPPPGAHDDGPPTQDKPPEPQQIDAGSWDGSGFWSSGLVAADPYVKYSVTFTRRGTYEYACLIHPKMVGTVKVA